MISISSLAVCTTGWIVHNLRPKLITTWSREASQTWLRLLVFALSSPRLVLLFEFAVITNSLNYFGIGFPETRVHWTEKKIFVLQVDRIIKLKAEGTGKERVDAEEAILTALMKSWLLPRERILTSKAAVQRERRKGKSRLIIHPAESRRDVSASAARP